MNRCRLWARALRLQYLPASFLPVLLGATFARQAGPVSLFRLSLVLGGVFCYHAGANLVNDLYDVETDRLNRGATLLNGGSQVLAKGLLTLSQLRKAAFFSYLLGTAAALGLALAGGGWGVLLYALAGLGCGYFYSIPPLRLAATGLGELVLGLAFGPLLVLGTVTALTGAFFPGALLVSWPVGLFITAVILINEIPDYESDRRTGKRTLAVRLGPEKSFRLLALLLTGAVFSLGVALLRLRVYPLFTGFLLLLPLAGWVWSAGRRRLKEGEKLFPACAGMILLHLLNGVVLILAVWHGG